MTIKDKTTRARILFKQDYGRTFKIKIEKPDFSFISGQFLSIGLDTPNGFIVRPYSIVSSNEENYLEFFIAVVEDGKLTPYLSKLKAGDYVHILTPKGHFSIDKVLNEKIYFIATGTGIAPFISMIRAMKEKNTITVFWGNSYQKDFEPYKDELKSYLGNRDYFISSREIHCARIPDYLNSFDFLKESTIMACGNPNMTREIQNKFKESVNQIIIEDYWKEKQ